MHIKPIWAKRSFAKRLQDIWTTYPDNESDVYWVRTENQDTRMELFNELLKWKTENYGFVDNCLQDITYLHLRLIAKRIGRDIDEELDKYISSIKFIKEHKSEEQIKMSDYEETLLRSEEIISWIESLQNEIETLIEE